MSIIISAILVALTTNLVKQRAEHDIYLVVLGS